MWTFTGQAAAGQRPALGHSTRRFPEARMTAPNGWEALLIGVPRNETGAAPPLNTTTTLPPSPQVALLFHLRGCWLEADERNSQ